MTFKNVVNVKQIITTISQANGKILTWK